MNDMTDAQISKALALAIGWKESEIIDYPDQDYVGIRTRIVTPCIRLFSYKFPAVIFPVAERFDCFPYKDENRSDGMRYAECINKETGAFGLGWADTAAKAVALAVIAAHGG